MNIGHRLKYLRYKYKYSQQEIANKLDIKRSTYNAYENNYARPTKKINELAKIFGVTTDFILGTDEFKRKSTIKEATIKVIIPDLFDIILNSNYTVSGRELTLEERKKILKLIKIVLD